MALNKKSLGPAILSKEKGTNEEISDNFYTLNEFALLENGEETMICFTVEEIPDKYFWASTTLFDFLYDNIENAEPDEERLTFSFPEDEVAIKHTGKVPLKNDKTKSANTWKIEC